MGVDFYYCECCKESKYSEYVKECECCRNNLCTHCLVNKEFNSSYAYDYCIIYDGSEEQKKEYGIGDDYEEKGYVTIGEVIVDTGIDPKYCPFCEGKAFDEKDFLQWLISYTDRSRVELMNEYLKQKSL